MVYTLAYAQRVGLEATGVEVRLLISITYSCVCVYLSLSSEFDDEISTEDEQCYQVDYYYPGQKKNHHRDSRREERCSTCDIMLDQARSAQGKSDPPPVRDFCPALMAPDRAYITRGTAFFSPRISRMVLFFVQG